jgi:DNA-binding transcriptional MerR regulator
MPPAQSSPPSQKGAGTSPGERLVATLTGLTKRTLRYYEEFGLLDPPTRTEGGYRLYTPSDIQRLERIKRLKDLLGIELAEIREFVQVDEEREQVRAAYQREPDPEVRLVRLDDAEALVRRQLRLVEEKLTGLQDMHATLQARLARYDELRADLREVMRRQNPPAN